MATRYLNWRGPCGLETIDEFTPPAGMNWKSAETERRRLATEYAIAGMAGCYWSSRPCKGWK